MPSYHLVRHGGSLERMLEAGGIERVAGRGRRELPCVILLTDRSCALSDLTIPLASDLLKHSTRQVHHYPLRCRLPPLLSRERKEKSANGFGGLDFLEP